MAFPWGWEGFQKPWTVQTHSALSTQNTTDTEAHTATTPQLWIPTNKLVLLLNGQETLTS